MHESSRRLDKALNPEGSRSLNYSRVLYFGYFMAIGAYLPYVTLYYERIGMSGVEIGIVVAIAVLVGSISALVFNGIGDAFAWQSYILRTALFFCPVMIFLLSKATTLPAIIIIVTIYALFSGPILAILDSQAVESAKTHQSSYGSLRLWGTIGWSISTLLVGALVDRFDLRWLFYSYVVFMTFTFLVSLSHTVRLPRMVDSVRSGLRQLLRPHFIIFLLSILLMGITLGGFNSFFSIYLDGIHASEGVIGLAWTLASLSEIPVLFRSGLILRKISPSGLLKIAFLAYAFRWLLLSFISTPVLALLTQLLLGGTFAVFLVGGITYVSLLAPEGLNTTAQSIFSSVSYGLAVIIGSLLGGYFYDRWGMAAMFRSFSLIVMLGFFIFLIGDRMRRSTSAV